MSEELLSGSLDPLGSLTCNVVITEYRSDVYFTLTIVFHDIAYIATLCLPAWLLVVFVRSSFGQYVFAFNRGYKLGHGDTTFY